MVLGEVLIVLLTIFAPPLGVFLVAGCGVDLLINICLTLLGVIPGHIHAFYIEYVYYSRRDAVRAGGPVGTMSRAGGVYSDRVQNGGYGTMSNQGAQQSGVV